MSPASYQTAPPRVGYSSFRPQSGKRDSNPRPQPWQGCALPTELFPRVRCNLTAQWARPPSRPISPAPPIPPGPPHLPNLPVLLSDGGEGDRTPDLVNAIHALSQLSYAPVILGPRCYGLRKTRSGGNTASYRDVVAVSSVFAPSRELFGLYPVSNGDPGR